MASPSGGNAGGQIAGIFFSADGKTCVSARVHETDDVILAEGLR